MTRLRRPAPPPRLLERMLRRLLPPGIEGDAILGDLREENALYVAQGGAFPRALWFLRAAGVAATYARSHLRNLAVTGLQEAGWALRGLLRVPVSSAAAVVVIALGMGLSTTMASVAYGLFVRDMDVPAAHELRVVEYRDPLVPGDAAPPDLFQAWREAPGAFRGLAGFRVAAVNLAAGSEPADLRSAGWITPDAFELLGVTPAVGRQFVEDDVEAGTARVVLLSHDLWRTRFGGGDVVGTDVRLDGRPVRVVGIMPPGFAFPMSQELWLPTIPWIESADGGESGAGDATGLVAFGRLRPGGDQASATEGLETVIRTLRPEGASEVGRSVGVRVVRFNEFRGGGVLRLLLGSMMAAALLVLLVASANVAGLLLARTTARLREVGLRAALGGGVTRTALPFVAQGALLAGAGTLLGLGIASVGVDLFEGAASVAGKPYWMHVRIDLPILLFTAGVTVLVAVGAAAGPVLLALQSDPADLLRSGGRGVATTAPGRSGRVLVVLQIALSCALLVGSGLVARSLLQLTAMDFPFAREDVLTANVRSPSADYASVEAQGRFHEDLLARLDAVPGVERAALAYGLPSLAFEQYALQPEGPGMDGGVGPADVAGLPRAWRGAGTPGILGLLAMEPLRGRGFVDTDVVDAEGVAVIEADLATALFGATDPIGRRFREIGRDGAWRRVVGVTAELRLEGITDLDQGMGYYVPLAQAGEVPTVTLLVNGRSPAELAAPVGEAVAALDRDITVTDIRTLRAMVGETSFFYEVFGGLFASFGLAGLFMACVGLYGILSWSVARRVPEMGMRKALGASRRSLIQLVMRDAAVQTGIGLVLGLGLAALSGDALSMLLFQVEPRDPLVYGVVAALVTAVGLGAAAVPALRAARIDPVRALLSE